MASFRNYKFLFSYKGNDTVRECTMERAIELAREKIINGVRKLTLSVLHRGKYIKLGVYAQGQKRTVFDVNRKPFTVDEVSADPVLPKYGA